MQAGETAVADDADKVAEADPELEAAPEATDVQDTEAVEGVRHQLELLANSQASLSNVKGA